MYLKSMLCAAALLLVVTPCAAVAQVQIKFDPQKEFKHEPSGIVVASAAAGLPRDKIAQYDDKQLDLSFDFRSADDQEDTTVYIFRKVTGNVPLWFDRIEHVVEARKEFASPTVAIPAAAFTPAGQSNARALRVVYSVRTRPWKSTAAALTTTGEWYVSVRASSKTLTPEQLLTRLEQTFTALRWPKEKAAPPVAVPVSVCATALEQSPEDAKPAPDDGAALLLSAITPSIAMEVPAEQQVPQQWCRDPMNLTNFGVYRPGGAKDRYLIAFQDAGRGISVAPDALAGILAKEKGEDQPTYAVQLIVLDRAMGFGSFQSLPRVAQAVRLVTNGKPKFSTSTWGKNTNVNIDAGAFK